MSEENPVNRSQAELPAESMVSILKDFFGFVSARSKAGIAVAQERGRNQLELRQLKRDRNKRLEKLGREVIALLEAGEVEHPGLSSHISHIHALDERIRVQAAQSAVGEKISENDSEE